MAMTDRAPEPAARRDLLVGNGAAFVMTLLWGTNFPLVEQLLRSWDIFSATAARQFIGAVTLLVLLVAQRRRWPLRRGLPWGRLVALGVVGPGMSSTLTSLAIATAGSVSVAVVYAVGPLVAALVARYGFGIPLQPGISVGIVLAVAGGLVMKAGQLGTAELGGGELFMVASLVCWTWYSVAAQRWLKGMSQLEIVTLTMLPGGLLLVLLALVLAAMGLFDVRAPLDGTTIPLALYIGMVPIAVGNLLWHTGVSRLGVTLMAIYGNFVPVAAILLAVGLGARPTVWHLAGGVVILAGVIYAQLQARRSRPTP